MHRVPTQETSPIPVARERENPSGAERGETASALVFTVRGVPVPQGSMKGFVLPSGQVAITSDNPKLKQWRKTVADTARVELWCRPGDQRQPLAGPVRLALVFVLPRPPSLAKRIVDHVHKPDLDKLVRAVCDALTGVVWVDDRQVVRLHAEKEYGAVPGVSVIVGADRAGSLF